MLSPSAIPACRSSLKPTDCSILPPGGMNLDWF